MDQGAMEGAKNATRDERQMLQAMDQETIEGAMDGARNDYGAMNYASDRSRGF